MTELKTQIQKFWDYNHVKENIDSLSGCKYDETIDFLQINSFIKENINVLEIGVGLGYVTKGLYDNKCKVSCVDISDVALYRVKDYCENIYNIENIDKLPSEHFDVIICNNVIQHVKTDLLLIELKEFIRSLKKDGILAVEFVSSDLSEDMGLNPTMDDIMAGRLCRTPKYLENIFNQFDCDCKLVFNNEINVGVLKGHHVFHVTKNI